MELHDGHSPLDEDRLAADLLENGRALLSAYSAPSSDDAAKRRNDTLAAFAVSVVGYITETGADPCNRHEVIAQALQTLEFLQPNEQFRLMLIEEFYYSVITRLLDEKYGNSIPGVNVGDEIDHVRQQLKGTMP